MIPFAVVSDIHSNLEALQAVLADIEEQDVNRILCLGDIIGYGPDPLPCLKIAMDRFEFSLMGNHEYAVLEGATEDYSEISRESLDWTRNQIKGLFKKKYWNYISKVEERKQEGIFGFIHASPRNPVFEYVLNERVAKANFDFVARGEKTPYLEDKGIKACFVGHTHQPAIFEEKGKSILFSDEHEHRISLEDIAIINTGSVGQPRDGNHKASYVLVRDDMIFHRRVAYPYEKTMKKIESISALDNFLAERLSQGK